VDLKSLVVPTAMSERVYKLVGGSEIDTTRRRHQGSAPTIWAGRFVPGGGALIGAPFALGGMLMLLVAAGVISGDEFDDWPPVMLVIFALPFLTVGLGLICSEYFGQRNTRRMKERQLRYPGKVWCTDYPWNETGTDDGNLRQAVGTCLTALFLTIFLTPFNLMVFADPNPLFILGIVLFDVLLLCIYGASVICWVRLMRFGRSRIRFGRFPFFLGHTLEVTFLGPRSLVRAGNLIFTLRCIIGEREEDSRGRSRTALYQIYADSCSLAPSADSLGSHFTIDLAFPLPEEDYQTCLRGGPLRFWELHVKADPGVFPFQATFLVPVYTERR
jgi:hypothetical protein